MRNVGWMLSGESSSGRWRRRCRCGVTGGERTGSPVSPFRAACCPRVPSSAVRPLLGVPVAVTPALRARRSSGGTCTFARTHWVTVTRVLSSLSIPRFRAYLGATSARLGAVWVQCPASVPLPQPLVPVHRGMGLPHATIAAPRIGWRAHGARGCPCLPALITPARGPLGRLGRESCLRGMTPWLGVFPPLTCRL